MGETNQIEALRIALEAIRDNKHFNNGVTAQAIADEALTSLASLIVYSKEKDREIERLTNAIVGSSEPLLREYVLENRGLKADLSASQAREREAVERAEKAEAQRRHDDDADTACRNLLCEERDIAESALAAARKALGRLLDAAKVVRVFVTSRERIHRPDGEEWFDAEIEAARAALNGDSHVGGEG